MFSLPWSDRIYEIFLPRGILNDLFYDYYKKICFLNQRYLIEEEYLFRWFKNADIPSIVHISYTYSTYHS